MHVVGLRDRRLARVVRACQELPGQRLFQYVDDAGEPRTIDSDDVNEYIRTAMGDDFSAKDFRTWAGTVLAARALQEVDEVTEQEATDGAGAAAGRSSGSQPTKAALARAVKRVAADLGNTAAVCRRCYIHPAIIDAYLDGSLAGVVKRQATEMLERGGALSSDERHVLRLLKSRVAGERRRGGVATRTVARAA
jgi:DNA topoisomerase-1